MSIADQVAEYLSFLAPTIGAKTLANNSAAVGDFHRFVGPHQPTSDDLAAWVGDCIAAGQAKHWIKSKLICVRRFSRWAEEKGYAPSPFTGAVLPNIPRTAAKLSRQPISDVEYQKLLALLRKRERTVLRNLFIVAHETGLRMSDAATLKWSAVDWKEEILSVTPMKTQRWGKTVTVPFTDDCRAALKAQQKTPFDKKSSTGDAGEFVFPSYAETYLRGGRCAITVQASRWMKMAGIKGRTFHALRHGFVSKLANSDVPYKVITGLTGQHPRTIAQYHHITTDTLRKAMLKLSEPAKKIG